MKSETFKSNILLLITAVIWGFAFVAQRVGMKHVEPFIFNAVRFALGSLSLIPLLIINQRRQGSQPVFTGIKKIILSGGLAGIILFIGATLQQVGIIYTTAGKSGFITGLYVVIVPIIGLLFKQKPDFGTWLGVVFAIIGLYLLSVTEDFTILYGDFLVFIGAFFWAGHVQVIAWLTSKINPIQIAFGQFTTCSILSLIVSLCIETSTIHQLYLAIIPILYGGLMSVGIAYTLQVVAQKNAQPTHAAIILSLETVFAAFGGWLILDETFSLRGIIGCVFMLTGMLLSQLKIRFDACKDFFIKARN